MNAQTHNTDGGMNIMEIIEKFFDFKKSKSEEGIIYILFICAQSALEKFKDKDKLKLILDSIYQAVIFEEEVNKKYKNDI